MPADENPASKVEKRGVSWDRALTALSVIVAAIAVGVAINGTHQQADQFQASQDRQLIADCQASIGRLRDETNAYAAQLGFLKGSSQYQLPGTEERLAATIDVMNRLYSADSDVGYQCTQVPDLDLDSKPNPPPATLIGGERFSEYQAAINRWTSSMLQDLESREAKL